MQTIRLRVNDNNFSNLMWFLKKFNQEEIQVINENNEYLSVQKYLENELLEMESGNLLVWRIWMST
ncbi:MAG: hypothetical protein K9H16_04725 [Bacteroidales bacterium]|nr:hypothetical protein [Bacteroidales bacterium]